MVPKTSMKTLRVTKAMQRGFLLHYLHRIHRRVKIAFHPHHFCNRMRTNLYEVKMAEAAVSFLLDQLSVLVREEQQLLGGLEREVEYIRDEMGQMNEFLRVAIEKDESYPSLKEWIRQLREIAYDVEDVLEKYVFRFGGRDANVSSGCIKKVYTSVRNFKARHQIASEIEAIKYRLQHVSTSRQRYRDMNAGMDQGFSSVVLKMNALMVEVMPYSWMKMMLWALKSQRNSFPSGYIQWMMDLR